MDLDSSLPLVDEHITDGHSFDGTRWEEDWELETELGTGASGQVHLVRHRRCGKRGALKRPLEGDVRIRREREILQTLRHPNVMPVLAAGGDWYVMPLAEGTAWDLAPECSDDDILLLALHCARGLDHAHQHGYVHRDVSPSNVLRICEENGDERWVIGDFGMVRRPPGQTTGIATRGGAGTLGFAAPETLANAHSACPRADIFSLGQVMKFLLTGRLPTYFQHIDFPAPWSKVIEHMTQPTIDQRPKDMASLIPRIQGLKAALRRKRRDMPRDRTESMGEVEAKIMAGILELGSSLEFYREDELLGSTDLSRRDLSFGLMELRHRGFLSTPCRDDEPTVVTEAGQNWLRENRGYIRSLPTMSPETAATGFGSVSSDDDIPF